MKKAPRLLTAIALAALSSQTMAYEAGQFVVRAGPANVDPVASSSVLSLGGTPIPGTGVDVDSNTQLGLTFTYALTDNLGIGVLAATPFKHDVIESGLGVGTVATVKHLPPTVTLQYFPMDNDSKFQPYVGAGFNFTTFFDEETSGGLNAALGSSSIKLDDSFGLALELGADYQLNDTWMLNFAVWKIDIDTEAVIESPVGNVTVDVEIDPYVYMLGVGYKF